MKRRRFNYLLSLAGLSPLALKLNKLHVNVFEPASLNHCRENSNVLVLIQLKGGNDGLNTLIPWNQYDLYAKIRPTIHIPEKALIPLDQTLPEQQQLGLHPALSAMKNQYDNGQVAIVQSVAYPNVDRSHFKSTDLWLTGGDGNPVGKQPESGWIGRFLKNAYPDKLKSSETFSDPLAIQLGNPNSSLAFQIDEQHDCSVNISGQDPSGYYTAIANAGGQPPSQYMDTFLGKEMQYIVNIQQTTCTYAKRISSIFNKGKNAIQYPDTDLANQLKTVARLLNGGSQTKVFLVQLSDFDTHKDQVVEGNVLEGEHAILLKELSTAVAAFSEDLKQLGLDRKVLSMTFSEFGRKATENGDLGTDHGSMAPLFLFGTAIQGGIFGHNDDLKALDENNLLSKMQYDYRTIYTTVLKHWLGATDELINAMGFDPFLKEAPVVFK